MIFYFKKHSPEETWKTLQELKAGLCTLSGKQCQILCSQACFFFPLLFHFSFLKYTKFNMSMKSGEHILRLLFQLLLFGGIILGLTPPQDYQICFSCRIRTLITLLGFYHQPKCISKPNYFIYSFKKYKETNIFKRPIPQFPKVTISSNTHCKFKLVREYNSPLLNQHFYHVQKERNQ